MKFFKWLFQGVSKEWLEEQRRKDMIEEHHNVSIDWPIRKSVNEASQFQTRRLRKKA